jgi:hypothetical protein
MSVQVDYASHKHIIPEIFELASLKFWKKGWIMRRPDDDV